MIEFDAIRPYNDNELPAVFEELIADPDFRQVVTAVFPSVPFEMLAQEMRQCRTKFEFQKKFCYVILRRIEKESTNGVTLNHTAITDKSAAYTYISNHRDIILDSGFLDIELVLQGLDTVEIAIGDNLFIYPWIKKVVRINKSFIVQRGLPMRQMLESSTRLSDYMHHTIADKKQSIWIAQREGRAKDSDDLTQESLLKMLVLGGEGDIIDRLSALNIAPLAISYEFDPCDYLKAQEFQQKRDNPAYKKTPQDDWLNMESGLLGRKGHVHLKAAACINDELATIDRSLPKQEIFLRVAALIDRRIHSNYRIYPANYIAHDYLSDSSTFIDYYTEHEKREFYHYIDEQLERITLPDKDIPFLRKKLLLMYANPLTNHLTALKNSAR
ncbi:MAG: acyltransferase [Mediterranea sp.]|jgi:hypothetical protein|nr:acyltransferase [Mediterranea sp.]